MIYTDPFGKSHECSDLNGEWRKWSDDLWIAMLNQGHPAMCHVEQLTMRSHREKRCMSCGEKGRHEHKSLLIAAVPTFWLCDVCQYD